MRKQTLKERQVEVLYGSPLDNAAPKKDWITRCNESAMALTKEKRQEFLDYMFADLLNLGEAAKRAGITSDEATGIININIVKSTSLSLNRETI